MSDEDDETPDAPGETADAPGQNVAEQTLRIYLSDSTLWPVLFVGFATFTTLGIWLLWLAIAGRNPFGIAALLILFGMSIDLWQRDVRRRRLGPISRIVFAWWAISACGALVLTLAS